MLAMHAKRKRANAECCRLLRHILRASRNAARGQNAAQMDNAIRNGTKSLALGLIPTSLAYLITLPSKPDKVIKQVSRRRADTIIGESG